MLSWTSFYLFGFFMPLVISKVHQEHFAKLTDELDDLNEPTASHLSPSFPLADEGDDGRQASGASFTLTINGVGTCIVIPQVRCFCCQFTPAGVPWWVGRPRHNRTTTITTTTVSTTLCSVYVNSTCPFRDINFVDVDDQYEVLADHPRRAGVAISGQNGIEENPSIDPSQVTEIEITPEASMDSNSQEKKPNSNNGLPLASSLLQLARQVAYEYVMKEARRLKNNFRQPGIIWSSMFRQNKTATINIFDRVTRFYRRRGAPVATLVSETTTITSVTTTTSTPLCFFNSPVSQCPS